MHEHSHDDGPEFPDLAHLPSDPALRVRALESLLTEKGLVRPETIDAFIEKFEHEVGPHNGARVVARAWVDPAFRERLLADATTAIGELDLLGAQTSDVVAVDRAMSGRLSIKQVAVGEDHTLALGDIGKVFWRSPTWPASPFLPYVSPVSPLYSISHVQPTGQPAVHRLQRF